MFAINIWSYLLWSPVRDKIAKYIGFVCVYRRSHVIWSPVIVRLMGKGWDQITQGRHGAGPTTHCIAGWASNGRGQLLSATHKSLMSYMYVMISTLLISRGF